MNNLLPVTERDAKVNDLITYPYPKFHDIDSIDWKPWVMEGVEYKLVSVNTRSNGFTIYLKVAPNTIAPVHHHLGSIELLVLEGDITYDGKDIGRPGSYMFEPAGDIHQPRTTKGCILFCVFEGPIAGLDDDGGILGIVDGKTMRAMAEGHGSSAILDQTSV
ncbi:MAG: 2,4'-dihydroxyacetophenone dioxygenase family protein [Amaricoccus sp.]|uniref:2,4'-dihydroxyacetophenone dioxygenase family protein n=1 Tax=Amaricoccus sp. TaxID=1872485 RepID=UPI003314DB97